MLEILIYIFIYLIWNDPYIYIYKHYDSFAKNGVLKHTIPGYRVSVEYNVFQNTVLAIYVKIRCFFGNAVLFSAA